MKPAFPLQESAFWNAPKLFLEAFQGACRVGLRHPGERFAQERTDAGKAFASCDPYAPASAGRSSNERPGSTWPDHDVAARSIAAIGTHWNVAEVVAKFPHRAQCLGGPLCSPRAARRRWRRGQAT